MNKLYFKSSFYNPNIYLASVMFWHFSKEKNLYLLILLVLLPIIFYSFDFVKKFSNKKNNYNEETKLKISEIIQYVYFRRVNGKRIIRETNIIVELFSITVVSLVLIIGLNSTNLTTTVISSFCTPFIIAYILDRTHHVRYFRERPSLLQHVP